MQPKLGPDRSGSGNTDIGARPVGVLPSAATPMDVAALPEPLWRFMRESCGLRADALRMLPPGDVPEPARRLLVHRRDMTTTLAEFHGAGLCIELFQTRRSESLYLREVFLRTVDRNQIVEYGVIAIALDRFGPVQQEAIQAGQTPLGELLHRFKIPFVSAPIGFFAIAANGLAATRFARSDGSLCYGRFNQLAKASGDPLAWIMEILPSHP